MTWTVENQQESGAIWAGQDDIINMRKIHHDKAGTSGIGCTAAILIGGLVLFAMLASSIGADFSHDRAARDKLDNTPLLFLFFLIAACGVAWAVYWSSLEDWVHRPWKLVADGEKMAFRGPQEWALPLNQIASVEAGKTTDWQKVRDYNGESLMIPPDEWQTFLVLTDQSRRVIYTANVAREDCGALAASIRAHVEAHRASASPVLPAAPSGDGFNL